MFKLVIVEDEDNIRHSLECFIPWDKIGFQIVGAFSDGSDALDYLRDNPCDAVLTDILMNRMSGLEMIQQLHKLHPRLKVVILSGHSDFSYAQQAIAYQVAHYLVKPVDEEELIAVFQGLKEQLDREEEQVLAETANRELKQMLQKNFFRELLSGNISLEQELKEYLKLLGMEEGETNAGLLAYEVEGKGAGVAFPGAVLESHRSSAGPDVKCFCIEGSANHWQVVFVGRDNKTLLQYGGEVLQRAITHMNENAMGAFSEHLTHNVLHISDLLATPKDRAAAQQQTDEAVVSDYKLLVVELDLGCEETLTHLLVRTVRELEDMSVEDMRLRLQQIYSGVEQNYRKRKVDVWEITNGRFHSNHLLRASDEGELIACVTEDFRVLCQSLRNRGHRSEHNVISRIVQYLDEHLEEDISHDAIAAKYRLHPGYLSRLFKQEMGETLSEHLLRIKIERAAQLLKEDRYKIGEIAGMVGYSTSSYFSVMFKKYTGCTPREYCQRVSL